MLINLMLLAFSLTESQTSWTGGDGIIEPVTNWAESFYSSEGINWYPSEENLSLDFAENTQITVIDYSGGAPFSVVPVNMDSDTDTDILVSYFSDDVIAWHRNNGSYWDYIEIASDFNGANSAQPFDMNDDGFIDVVATAFYDNSLYWFESDSSEYLWIPHAIAAINRPMDVVPLIHSGQVQLLVAESDPGYLHLFKCSVQPDTVYYSQYQIPGLFPGIESIELADIDLDGDQDILLTEYNNSTITLLECISWYSEFVRHEIDSDIPRPNGLSVGDINGDNLPDIVATSFDDNSVYWYENTGTSWNKHLVGNSLWGAAGTTICSIAETEDGWQNIVATGCYDSEVRWYAHDSSNQWQEYTLGYLTGASAVCTSEFDTIEGIEVVAVAGMGDSITCWSPGELATEGTLASSILDGVVGRVWSGLSWESEEPDGTTVSFQVRSSNTWEDMGLWSEEFFEPTELYEILTDTTRYFQYKVNLTSSNSTLTPILNEVLLSIDDVGISQETFLPIGNNFKLTVSKNPTTETLVFTVTTTFPVFTKLLDISGRIVETFYADTSGTFQFQRSLKPGIYFLHTDTNENLTYKIVVTE